MATPNRIEAVQRPCPHCQRVTVQTRKVYLNAGGEVWAEMHDCTECNQGADDF